MAYFQTNNPILGSILESLAMEDVGVFYRLLVIFCGHLEYFMVIWCIFPRFGMFFREKSGNPKEDVDVCDDSAASSDIFCKKSSEKTSFAVRPNIVGKNDQI
jgi:hypothetical protein